MSADWILPLIGGLGIGTILAKVIDVAIMQKAIEKRELKSWLREKRFEAYSKLSEEILNLNTSIEFSARSLGMSASTILLLENRYLVLKIRQLLIRMSRYEKFRETEEAKEIIKGEDGTEITKEFYEFDLIQVHGMIIVEKLAEELKKV